MFIPVFIIIWLYNYFNQITINPTYKITPLPGDKEGISGSCIGGYNLGISVYSDSEYRNASIEAFKYITSKEIQRKYVLENGIGSAISDLYDEEGICEKVDCQFYKNVQPIGRYFNNINSNYDSYSERYRNYMYEFLYNNKSAEEVLEKIEDIYKIHYVSIKTRQLLLLGSALADIGPKHIQKCQLKLILTLVGHSFTVIPILYRLLINIQDDFNFYIQINRHKYVFILFFVIIDLLSLVFTTLPIFDINVNNINITNYIFDFGIPFLLKFISSVAYYYFLFGIRIIWALRNKNNNQKKFINSVNKAFMESSVKENTFFTESENSNFDKITNNNGLIVHVAERVQINNNNENNIVNTKRSNEKSNNNGIKRGLSISELTVKFYNYHNNPSINNINNEYL
ncbi:hypothetical protein PIROE2DRAFT_11309 [Piromyces sp. E2]|nr:hypothetical protein PIROE2DRAFT_11309 [Piromyces sp. E2]|eukprot:OUM62402.1 hypothetical protein PIROE2DRAFT_11309 [Piromyces sp. E2]